MQGVNGFSPPSKRHPVAPTTLKEKGEVPIPLPVLCSRGGGSGRRQLYTKMTDHRFCCLPACLPACLPGFFCLLRSTQDFPLIQEWDVDGNARAVHYATLNPWFWHSQNSTNLGSRTPRIMNNSVYEQIFPNTNRLRWRTVSRVTNTQAVKKEKESPSKQ